jgi:hypothetical protein
VAHTRHATACGTRRIFRGRIPHHLLTQLHHVRHVDAQQRVDVTDVLLREMVVERTVSDQQAHVDRRIQNLAQRLDVRRHGNARATAPLLEHFADERPTPIVKPLAEFAQHSGIGLTFRDDLRDDPAGPSGVFVNQRNKMRRNGLAGRQVPRHRRLDEVVLDERIDHDERLRIPPAVDRRLADTGLLGDSLDGDRLNRARLEQTNRRRKNLRTRFLAARSADASCGEGCGNRRLSVCLHWRNGKSVGKIASMCRERGPRNTQL